MDSLYQLVGSSPDYQALVIRARRHFPDLLLENGAATFEDPPMLKVGLNAIIHASADQRDLLPENSSTEELPVRLIHDSPWSTFNLYAGKDSPVEANANVAGDSGN